jgi:hypothetical protein
MNPTITIPIAADLSLPVWRRHFIIPAVAAAVVLVSFCVARLFIPALIVAPLLGLFTYFIILRCDGSRRVTFTVGNGRLEVRGDFFGETFSLSDLDLEHAEVVDLTRHPQHGLRWKTMGTGMPGYYSGEYTLRSGKPAVVFIADRKRVLYIPRGREPALLLSVPEPDTFKNLLIQSQGLAAASLP